MYLDVRLLGNGDGSIHDEADFSNISTLNHLQCNKHGPLQSAIDEIAFADEFHITPDDHP